MLDQVFGAYGVDGHLLHAYKMGVYSPFRPRPMKLIVASSHTASSLVASFKKFGTCLLPWSCRFIAIRRSDPQRAPPRATQPPSHLSHNKIRLNSIKQQDIVKPKMMDACVNTELSFDGSPEDALNTIRVETEKKKTPGRPPGRPSKKQGQQKNRHEQSKRSRKIMSRDGNIGAIVIKQAYNSDTPGGSPSSKFARVALPAASHPHSPLPISPG